MPYLAAVRRSVTVFCSDVKLPGILTALLASALITFSGEQAASTEKWTAPAAEARLGASLSNFGSVNPLQDPTLDPTILPATRLPLTTIGRPRQMRTKFQSPSNPPIRTNQRSWPLFCLGADSGDWSGSAEWARGGDSYDFADRQFRRSFLVKTERRAWRLSTSFIRFDDVTALRIEWS